MKIIPIIALLFWLFVYLSHEPHIQVQSAKAEPAQTTKEIIVADVSHDVLKWPRYTVRVWLDGKRKTIPKITWETNEERIKYFLRKYWLESTYSLWIKNGEKYGIDPIFAISIAWSETHMWQAKKTPNNFCNVGNTDSWATKTFESREIGIEKCFSVFHGKYLKGYSEIKYLSGEGRTRAQLPWCIGWGHYCFATSKYHWETNVVNLMSALYNRQIDWTFIFRKI